MRLGTAGQVYQGSTWGKEGQAVHRPGRLTHLGDRSAQEPSDWKALKNLLREDSGQIMCLSAGTSGHRSSLGAKEQAKLASSRQAGGPWRVKTSLLLPTELLRAQNHPLEPWEGRESPTGSGNVPLGPNPISALCLCVACPGSPLSLSSVKWERRYVHLPQAEGMAPGVLRCHACISCAEQRK